MKQKVEEEAEALREAEQEAKEGAINRYREVLRKPGEVSNLKQKVEEEAEALEEAEQEAKEGAMDFPSSTRKVSKSDTGNSSPLPLRLLQRGGPRST